MIPPVHNVQGNGGLVAKGLGPIFISAPSNNNYLKTPPHAGVYVASPLETSSVVSLNAYTSVKGPRHAPVTPEFGHCFRSGPQTFTPVHPLSKLAFNDNRTRAGTIDLQHKPMWLSNI